MDEALKFILPTIGTVMSTVAVAYIKSLMARQDRRDAENVAIRHGLCALLRDKLLWLHSKHSAAGGVTADDLDSFDELTSAYEGLGGDGVVHKAHAEVHALPLLTGKERTGKQ